MATILDVLERALEKSAKDRSKYGIDRQTGGHKPAGMFPPPAGDDDQLPPRLRAKTRDEVWLTELGENLLDD